MLALKGSRYFKSFSTEFINSKSQQFSKVRLQFKSRNPPFTTLTKSFQTSPKRQINPLFGLLLKTKGIKVLKGGSILFGRFSRKWYERLPKQYQNIISKHKVSLSIASLSLVYISYYSYVHYDTCPITGRKRWISFTKDQILALAEINNEELKGIYGSRFLQTDSELYRQCNAIVKNIIKCNLDLPEVEKVKWRLTVVEDDDTNNAFVLPNGDIFVFTGMLKLLNNWEELAMIIGHEMSHAILGHVQEQQSFAVFSELLMVPILSFIWFVFDDFAAFLVYSLQHYAYKLIFEVGFNLPFSRMLEMEADEVGLMLASRACYDPRYSVLLWDKMALKAAWDSYANSDDLLGEIEYISTHPSNERRAAVLEKNLPEARMTRLKCNCPELSADVDPLKEAHLLRKLSANVRERTAIKQKITALEEKKEKQDDSSALEAVKSLQIKLAQLEQEFSKMTSEKMQGKTDIYKSWTQLFKGFFNINYLGPSLETKSDESIFGKCKPPLTK